MAMLSAHRFRSTSLDSQDGRSSLHSAEFRRFGSFHDYTLPSHVDCMDSYHHGPHFRVFVLFDTSCRCSRTGDYTKTNWTTHSPCNLGVAVLVLVAVFAGGVFSTTTNRFQLEKVDTAATVQSPCAKTLPLHCSFYTELLQLVDRTKSFQLP